MRWDAGQYLRFEAERTRPVHDLLARVPGPVERAVDLGCGPGNSTEVLAARFPDAVVEGIDSSLEMITAAQARLPGLRFSVADLAVWRGEGQDLLLANAVLQWLPDHAALLPRLLSALRPGGWLAVQMPDNANEPSHRLMREVSLAGPWAERQAGARAAFGGRRRAEDYFDILRAAGAEVDLWRTSYIHVLPGGPEAVVDWVSGTGLRPYLSVLEPEERADYLARYRAAISDAYPERQGVTLLPFPRLFFVAHRGA